MIRNLRARFSTFDVDISSSRPTAYYRTNSVSQKLKLSIENAAYKAKVPRKEYVPKKVDLPQKHSTISQDKLSSQILLAHNQKNYGQVLDFFRDARKMKVQLSNELLVLGVKSCHQVSSVRSLEAFQIYNDFLRENTSTIITTDPVVSVHLLLELMSHVLQIAVKSNSISMVNQLGRDHKKYVKTSIGDFPKLFLEAVLQLKITDQLDYALDSYLKSLLSATTAVATPPMEGSRSSSIRSIIMGDEGDEGNDLVSVGDESQLRGLLSEALKLYCYVRNDGRILHIIDLMESFNLRPTPDTCIEIMDTFLGTFDILLVKRMLELFEAYPDLAGHLCFGTSLRLAQIGASLGDYGICLAALKIEYAAGREIDPLLFGCAAMSVIHDQHFNLLINVLSEAEKLGIDLFQTCATDSGMSVGMDIQIAHTRHCERGVRFLDSLYFTLANRARNREHVPRIPLHAIIAASGTLRLLDRAFATFQEYDVLFGLGQPTRSTYNALLYAVSSSPSPSALNMLSVLEDMDAAGDDSGPDCYTFASLLEVLAEFHRFQNAANSRNNSGNNNEEDEDERGEDASQGTDPKAIELITDEILAMLKTKAGAASGTSICNGTPLGRALRRLTIAYAERGDSERVNDLLALQGYATTSSVTSITSDSVTSGEALESLETGARSCSTESPLTPAPRYFAVRLQSVRDRSS